MIRFLLLCSLLLSFKISNAQVIDIGQSDELAPETSKETKATEEKDTSKVVEEAKGVRGLFSFMNFNFGKKEDKKEERKEGDDKGKSEELTLEEKAEAGDVETQVMLGYLYLYGEKGFPVNYKKSFHYYSLAAEQNDVVAANNLGSLYYSGIGTERNTLKAAAMFEKAVSLGNSESAVNLAFIYLTGMGLPKDYTKALKFFDIAAKDNKPTSQFMLGYAYYVGFGVKKDLRKAYALMKEAATSKYDDAEYVLAKMYMNGDGVAKNYGNAVRYLASAAQQGNVDAMIYLGDILESGTVYTKNLYEAHVWYNIASVYGIPQAAEKRDAIEAKRQLKIEDLISAQEVAGKFVEKPSEVTTYIRATFGENIKGYIDEAFQKRKGTKTF